MKNEIFSRLLPVRRRLQLTSILNGIVVGLLTSGLFGLALALWRWWSGTTLELWVPIVALTVGPLAGLLFGLWRRNEWSTAAMAASASSPEFRSLRV